MNLQINEQAPNFTLLNSENQSVSLNQFQDKKNVVILFFPLAFTGVCTKELCDTRDNMAKYESLNAEILSISVDSIFTLAEFKKQQNYNFSLLSDFNKEVSKLYGTFYEEFVLGMKGVSKRSAFVVDKNGILRYTEVLEDASNVPNFSAIQECLQKI
ncbi:MAG: redoxin domain-containing protein [Chitinophagaceae bacterium]